MVASRHQANWSHAKFAEPQVKNVKKESTLTQLRLWQKPGPCYLADTVSWLLLGRSWATSTMMKAKTVLEQLATVCTALVTEIAEYCALTSTADVLQSALCLQEAATWVTDAYSDFWVVQLRTAGLLKVTDSICYTESSASMHSNCFTFTL